MRTVPHYLEPTQHSWVLDPNENKAQLVMGVQRQMIQSGSLSKPSSYIPGIDSLASWLPTPYILGIDLLGFVNTMVTNGAPSPPPPNTHAHTIQGRHTWGL